MDVSAKEKTEIRLYIKKLLLYSFVCEIPYYTQLISTNPIHKLSEYKLLNTYSIHTYIHTYI